MCGIAGLVDLQNAPDRDLAAAMAEVLFHRGPDESGVFGDDRCALAVRRLAILDIEAGHQPVFNEDRTVAVVFNGELYNLPELRHRLHAAGHRMRSNTDTEILPHLYEEHGDDFVSHLRGMFAIALWDTRRNRLVLARDRLGKKPLFWTSRGGEFRFASEIKALFVDRLLPREPNFAALHLFLSLGYIPAPHTAFTGVHCLPPAHQLVFEGGRVELRRYWSLGKIEQIEADPVEASELVRAALIDSVRCRLLSDVSLGLFLSGGVDSACVAAAMAEVSAEPIRTFTIGFEDNELDERALACLTARALGTDHTEHVVRADVAALLPLLVWHFDQPFADPSMLPTYAVAREARRDVTVALNGDGGDEAFGGYERIGRILGSPSGKRAGRGLPGLDRLPIRLDPMHPLSRVRRLALRIGGSLDSAYAPWMQVFPERLLWRLYSPHMRAEIDSISAEEFLTAPIKETSGSPLWRLQATEYITYLAGDLLPKVDIATMAVSLEARSPMLDHRFVELAASLPPEVKLGNGGAKLALKNAFRDTFPNEILEGRKRGFGIPVDRWIREDFAPVLGALFAGGAMSRLDIFEDGVVEKLLADHVSGRSRHGTRLFSLLCLELWLRTFIEAPPRLEPPADVALTDLI